MARIVIAGDAAVITSALKKEDIETVAKHRPGELFLRDENKDPVFGIATGTKGSISSSGAVFDGVAADGSGLATITILLHNDGQKHADFVVDKFGGAITLLNKLEERLPSVITQITTELEKVRLGITVAG